MNDGLLSKVTAALVVRPGDVLLVALPNEAVNLAQVEEFATLLRTRLPELADVIVVAATQLAVYRP